MQQKKLIKYLNELSAEETTIDLSIYNIKSLGLSPLTELPNLLKFSKLKKLLCCGNELTDIDLSKLPDSLEVFVCNNNKIKKFTGELPSKLIRFECKNNKLDGLPNLPHSLKYLCCCENKLPILPELPKSLIHLECSKNRLTKLPILPDKIKILNCNNNNLPCLPYLPNSLEKVYYILNYSMKKYPKLDDYKIIVKNYNFIYWKLRLKQTFHKWVWEKVKQQKAMEFYHPKNLIKLISDNIENNSDSDGDDDKLSNLIDKWNHQ